MSKTIVTHAIFYMHQKSGACAGLCTCNRMHQMDKTAYNHNLKVTHVRSLVFQYYMQLTNFILQSCCCIIARKISFQISYGNRMPL